jgi:hypothetical protein
MPFQIPEQKSAKTFEKTLFLKLDQGQHIVRFLEPAENATTVLTHYVLGKYTIACPGEDCPICKNNKELIMTHPEDFREQKGYSPRITNYLINVLDRTVVKVCSKCGEETVAIGGNKNNFPPTCSVCNSFITDEIPRPSNKVKLLKFGVQLATQLNTIEMATCNPDGDPLGLMNFDVSLIVEGAGRKKVTTPVPSTRTDAIPDLSEQFQNKERAMITLTASQVKDLLSGVSLKDIYAAQRATRVDPEAVKSLVESDSPAPWEDIKNEVANLLD